MSARDLTQGSVPAHLLRLGAPMVLGVLAVLSINLADAYFVGQLGTDELAALSFTFPVVLTITSLSIGLSAGSSSIVSRAIGRGDDEGAKRLATDSLALALLVVAIACGLGFLTVRPLFGALGADGHVLDVVVEYMHIWFLGMPFLVVPMVGGGLIRANGDSLAPSLIMVFAAITNVILDPIFIHGGGPVPELGVAGAAWASLASRAVTLLATAVLLVVREKLLAFSLPSWSTLKASWGQLLAVGVPAALSNMINPAAITLVTAILATFGKDTVAAFGVATRVESFAAIPMLALSSAIGPIAGQNWGCGAPDRTRQAMRTAFSFCLAYSVVGFGVFLFAAEPVMGVFTSDPTVIEQGALYLRIVTGTLAGYGVLIVASATYNAIDHAVRGLGLTLLRSGALYVPLASASLLVDDVRVAFIGIAIANVITGIAVWVLAFRLLPAPVDPT
ncbi:MAG: MATE family efflux transporter [Myxococcota bacterium]